MKKVLFVGLLLAAFSSFCLAAPTRIGPTGLIMAPSADSLRGGSFNLALHHYHETNQLSFVVGLADNLEAGLSAWKDKNHSDTSAFLKYTLVPETSRQVGLAIGGRVYKNSNSLFVVGSKFLSELGARGHIGFDTTGDGLFFMGLSKTLPSQRSFPKTIAMADFYNGNLNVGLRILLTNEVNLDLSLIDLDDAMITLGFHSHF